MFPSGPTVSAARAPRPSSWGFRVAGARAYDLYFAVTVLFSPSGGGGSEGVVGDPQAPLPAHPTTKVSQPCKSTCTARWRWSHWGAGFGGLRAAPPGRSRAGRSAATQPPPVREPPPHPVEGYERSIAPVSACAVHCNAAESSIHESKKAVDGRKS